MAPVSTIAAIATPPGAGGIGIVRLSGPAALEIGEALCQCLPDQLKDDTFADCLKDDKSTKHWLSMLLKNLENMTPGQQGAGQSMNAIGSNKNLAGGVKLPGGL